jgi:hypothetical protein
MSFFGDTGQKQTKTMKGDAVDTWPEEKSTENSLRLLPGELLGAIIEDGAIAYHEVWKLAILYLTNFQIIIKITASIEIRVGSPNFLLHLLRFRSH